MIELLAPAGDIEKLKTALHFGADAVYFAGKSFGLRAFSANFDHDQLKQAVDFVHSKNKKAYITVNIFARNSDFDALPDYLKFLQQINADAIIASDIGVILSAKKHAPNLKIHLSTQANTTNKHTARFMSDFVDRIILSRELSLFEIAQIKDFVPKLELEAFVHGAMCISFSGRCLLSDFITSQNPPLSGKDKQNQIRRGNRGECVQACRWPYLVTCDTKSGHDPAIDTNRGSLTLLEDERGSYILNSRDLNMINHIDKMAAAGITSFKIEGRAKSAYYVAGAVNAYRRAINVFYDCKPAFVGQKLVLKTPYICPDILQKSLQMISHRKYTTGFYFDQSFAEGSNLSHIAFNDKNGQNADLQTDTCLDTKADRQQDQNLTQSYDNSRSVGSHDFVAIVLEKTDDGIIIEQRNRFKAGQALTVLSPNSENGKAITIEKMEAAAGKFTGQQIIDANKVQQKIKIFTKLKLQPNDILVKSDID
ncbi:MAG: U32 family peptidase [Firmicutes bacterium]|nr:U32 family peptidase [Bacillota bacterium]